MSTKWLESHGVSAKLAYYYSVNGMLNRLGHGFYCLPNDEIDVAGFLDVLQEEVPGFHVASKSALAWYGISHYAYKKPQTIVWGKKARAIPEWAAEKFRIRYSTANLFAFASEFDDQQTRTLRYSGKIGVSCSCPERALLEMLYELPLLDMEEVRNLFDLIQYPREDLLAMLLKACRSIKVVRLFAQLAKESEMLDVERLYVKEGINTGSSARWQISIDCGKKVSVVPFRSSDVQ